MKLKYFKRSEFDCQETGENEMNPAFLEKLDKLRGKCGFPFRITSGYRSSEHSIEKKKTKPGTHALGIAADIRVNSSSEAYTIMKYAFELGFTGIARGSNFIHVDTRITTPVVWKY